MNIFRFNTKYFTTFLFGLTLLTCEHPTWAAELLAHRAIYSLELDTVRNGSHIIGVQGNASLSITRTCDGWGISQTIDMKLSFSDRDDVTQNLRFAGWESYDGTRYNFFSSNNVDSVRNDFRGRAFKALKNGTGNVNYSLPKNHKVTLPNGTVFPLSHTSYLIDRARAGERQISSILFDGSQKDPLMVTAFIGKKKQHKKHIINKHGKLLGHIAQHEGWKIRMGFYELNSQSSLPVYEMEILQLDNGITPHIIIDYQDFTIILTQVRLINNPLPNCL